MIDWKRSAMAQPPSGLRGWLIVFCIGTPEGEAWMGDPFVHLGRKTFIEAIKADDTTAYLASLTWWRVWRTT